MFRSALMIEIPTYLTTIVSIFLAC